jgi:hypothetical protein
MNRWVINDLMLGLEGASAIALFVAFALWRKLHRNLLIPVTLFLIFLLVWLLLLN